MKTARFSNVVKAAGAPQTYLFWTPPKDDKTFQRALKEHRVMTVHQELRGSKKDYGSVGFREEPNAQYLLFPKSIRSFADQKIIAINYDLLAGEGADSKVSHSTKKADTPIDKPSKLRNRLRFQKNGENVVAFTSTNRPAPTEDVSTLGHEFEPTTVDEKIAPGSKVMVRPRSARTEAKKEPIQSGTATKPESRPAEKLPTETPGPTMEPKRSAATRKDLKGADEVPWRSEVIRALKELNAGKAVAAYDRLRTLLEKSGG